MLVFGAIGKKCVPAETWSALPWIYGNIDQIDFFVHATPEEVKKEVKRVLDIAKP